MDGIKEGCKDAKLQRDKVVLPLWNSSALMLWNFIAAQGFFKRNGGSDAIYEETDEIQHKSIDGRDIGVFWRAG
ncbi:MAG: hypothetical protein PHW60_10430 [Kiritimatiellae bacterium]|nr:hypothetical protein [Kiritimatiellia bacterium]